VRFRPGIANPTSIAYPAPMLGSRSHTPPWFRDLDAGSWMDLFFVSAVTAVLGIRGYLELTGYPKVGGDALHVAHMLWGGLLMLVALVLALSFLGRPVRPLVAILGGLGFGTFLDEIGKFLTHDNDYFFQPAIAIMYVVLVLGYLGARTIQRRRPVGPAEQLANALRDLDEVLREDLDADEHARLVRRLRAAGPHPLAGVLLDRVRDLPTLPAPGPAWLVRWRRTFLDRYRRLASSRWFVRGLIVFFTGQFLVKVSYVVVLLVEAGGDRRYRGFSLADGVAEWGLMGSSVLSGVFVGAGVQALVRGRRNRALRRFQASVLVSLMLAQVFEFHLEQWSALTGLVWNLGLFTALRYALGHPSPDSSLEGNAT